jgi:hypothetical protein
MNIKKWFVSSKDWLVGTLVLWFILSVVIGGYFGLKAIRNNIYNQGALDSKNAILSTIYQQIKGTGEVRISIMVDGVLQNLTLINKGQ